MTARVEPSFIFSRGIDLKKLEYRERELAAGIIEERYYEDGKLVEIRKRIPPQPVVNRFVARKGGGFLDPYS